MEATSGYEVGSIRPIERAWVACAILVPVLVSLLSEMGATDLAYHIRAGQIVLDTGTIPAVDTFTFSVAGAAWLDQQWGAQVFLAFFSRFGAWATLKAVQAGLTGLSFGLVYLACRARGGGRRASALLTIGSFFVGAPALALRPQLIALPLFATAVWLLADRRRHPTRIWFVPAIALVLANVHGSFTMIPILIALAWLEDRVTDEPGSRTLLVLGGVTMLATLVNPFGYRVWVYAYDLSTDPVIRETINEWQPISLDGVAGWLMLVPAIAIAVLLARRTTPAPWGTIAMLVVFFLLAMAAQRAIVWWAVVAPVAIAPLFPDKRTDASRDSDPSLPAIALIGTLALAVLLLLPWWRGTDYQTHLKDAPPGLTEAVAASVPPGGKLLVHQPWGSWFEYALPDRPVFVDSRIEIIPRDIWVDYGKVGFAGAGWEDVLRRWEPDAIVANAEDWDLIPFLRRDAGWRVLYEDDDGVVFVPADA